jgi:putative DNA methylase
VTIRKKLIEVSIPLEAINEASAREKSIRHGHPSTLHLWWARRPLAACRAVLFAQLVDDPSAWPERFPSEEAQEAERRRLHAVIAELVKWENSNNETVLNKARWEIARSVAWGRGEEPPPRDDGSAILAYLQTKAPPVYDPFCGGGSIPLEAQRLGLRAYGSDLNPVAVLISKALVEIPPRFAGRPPVHPEADLHRRYRGAQGLAEDVRYYGQWMRDEAERRIGHLYPKARLGAPLGPSLGARASGPRNAGGTPAPPPPVLPEAATVIAWLWARTVRSPDPRAKGAMVPLVSSFMLSTKEGRKAWVEPVIDPNAPDGWRFEVKTGALSKADEERLKKGTIGRSEGGTCILTGALMPFSYIRTEGQTHGLGTRLMTIVAEGKRGRVYLPPDETHLKIAAAAKPAWEPEGDLPNNPRDFKTPNYGLKTFASLFTPRQLVALTTFSDLVGEARAKVLEDALGARASRPRSEWHTRRLPHWEAGETAQAITFRLHDSLPRGALDHIERELAGQPAGARAVERGRRIEALLDRGNGARHLADPAIARLVEDALKHFDGTRYHLHAWCVMPNHVHVLVTPLHGESLSAILHAWKSFTAKQANALLRRAGTFWQEEYFDRAIRNEAHFAAELRYIHDNPVKAGLCAAPEEWAFSSARGGDWRAGRPPSHDDTPLHQGGTGATAYADAVATYLAFAVDRVVDRHSSIATWDSSPSKLQLRNTFARQAIPMTWDFGEGNPFCSSSGTFSPSVEWVSLCVETLPTSTIGSISAIDAPKNSFPVRPIVISTDPPYYDNVGYADLSDFFYVWLKRSLGARASGPPAGETPALPVWPDLFRRLTTPKAEELVATPYRHGGKTEAEAFFMQGMRAALTAMRQAASDDAPLTIYYAFKQSELAEEGIVAAGWASFLQGVVDAGLGVDGTWPVRTELSNRMIAKDSNALASSIVLVCRKRPEDAPTAMRADFLRALRREMPEAVDKIRKASVGPVDMPQSVIGPGMGVFTRYARVLEDDDTPMTVRTALALINRVWGEIENELDANFDPETQVALAWFSTYGFDPHASGDLISMANAKNIPIEALFRSGVFENLHGKAVLTSRDGSAGLRPAGGRDARAPAEWTVWECVQHTARVLRDEETGGAEAAARLVAAMGPKAEDARALAYRLYEIASQKGWAAEALVYNELAQDWTNLEDRAARIAAPALSPQLSLL